MNEILSKLKSIDRRFIYTAMFLCVAIPLLKPLNLKITPTKPVQSLYSEIENMKPGEIVVLSFDYDPATVPEVHPMAKAIIRHCFRKNVKVLSTALWPQGPSLAVDAFRTVLREEADAEKKEFGEKRYGEDYAILSFCAGPTTGHPQIEQLCNDIAKASPLDQRGNPIAALKIMQGVTSLSSDKVKLIVTFSAGDPGIPAWVQIGQSRYNRKIAGGATAVQAPRFYPYIQSRQLCGFLGGLRGAAEYEELVSKKGIKRKRPASVGMDSQSFAHLLIMLLILMANIIILIEKLQKKNV